MTAAERKLSCSPAVPQTHSFVFWLLVKDLAFSADAINRRTCRTCTHAQILPWFKFWVVWMDGRLSLSRAFSQVVKWQQSTAAQLRCQIESFTHFKMTHLYSFICEHNLLITIAEVNVKFILILSFAIVKKVQLGTNAASVFFTLKCGSTFNWHVLYLVARNSRRLAHVMLFFKKMHTHLNFGWHCFTYTTLVF